MRRHCSVDGCNRWVEARGWCRLHYQRWYNLQPPPPHGPLVCECVSSTLDGLGECSVCHRIDLATLLARRARHDADPLGAYL